ncbi:MAG: glycosyltransferase family 4 protein [Thermoplasmatota archaeon]
MMKDVLMLCVRYPPAPGGAETHVKSIKEELGDLGYSVEIYTSDLYKEFPFTRLDKQTHSKDVKRHKAYSLPGDLHYIFFPSLIKSLASNDFDIYHAHSYGYFHVNAAALFKHLKDTPFVLTPHFHPEWSMWGGKKRKFIRGVYDSVIAQKVIDSADRIIGVSRNEIELLKGKLEVQEEKVRIIPNGINEAEFTPVPDSYLFRELYDIDDNLVLFTGRLATNKGLLTLIKSIPEIIDEYPNTTFALIGEDEGMKSKIIKLAKKLGVRDSLLITGYIKDYDVFKSAYSAADVYVLPSEYEAFGIVLLEAMMCETPCIGTRVGGVPEVIEDGKTGYIIEYGSDEQLSSKIINLLDDEKKRKCMGKAGRKRVLNNFTWKKVALELKDVYEELV